MSEVQPALVERIVLARPDDTIELRQLTEDDAEAYFALIQYDRAHLSQNGDPTAAKYHTAQAVRQSIRVTAPTKYRFGIWENGVMVGSNNLTQFDEVSAELGSWIGKQYIGHNYAARGRALLIDFGFNTLGLDRLISRVDKRNAASRRSVESSGLIQKLIDDGAVVYQLVSPNKETLWTSRHSN